MNNYTYNNNLLSVSEAGSILGISKNTIRRWERAGKIEVERTPGGHRRISWSEIQRLLFEKRIKSQARNRYKEPSTISRKLLVLRKAVQNTRYSIHHTVSNLKLKIHNLMPTPKPTTHDLQPTTSYLRSNRRRLFPLALIPLIILITLAAYITLRPSSTEAGWWNDGWSYRKKVEVTNAGSELNDHATYFNLDTASLISAGKMKSDCSDLRITDVNDNLIDHWASICNKSDTYVWIKPPTLGSDSNFFFIYYGNSNASTTAVNGDDMFEIFQDFDPDAGTWSYSETDSDFQGSLVSNTYQIYLPFSSPANAGTYGQLAKSFTFDGNPKVFQADVWDNRTNPASPGYQYKQLLYDSTVIQQDDVVGDEGGWHVFSGVSTPTAGSHSVKIRFYIQTFVVNYSTAQRYDNIRVAPYDADVSSGSPSNEQTAPAQSYSWWNDEWQYRQKITFGNSGAAVTDRKVKFDVDTAALTTDKLQADCDDIRFTDVNGVELQYYLDSAGGACDTSSTDYYVLFSNIYSGTTVIYMYYGNPNANYAGAATQFAEATFSPTSGPTFGLEVATIQPVAYWKFDEGYGQTVNDNSPQANNGYLGSGISSDQYDPVWNSKEMCVSENCLYFDGTDDFVKVNGDTAILGTNTTDFTISAWVRSADIASGDGIIYAEGNSADNDPLVQLGYNSGSLVVVRRGDGAVGLADTTAGDLTPYNNQWVHLAYVNHGTTFYTYINGNEVDTGSYSNPDTGTFDRVSIGIRRRIALDNPTNGFIDEVKIYPYGRSASEILEDYNRGAQVLGRQDESYLSDGLVGYWKMDEASNTTRTDSSGNSNDIVESTGDDIDGVGGKFGNAGDFENSSGEQEHMGIADASQSGLDIDSQITVAAWVNPESIIQDGTYGFNHIVSKWNAYALRLFDNDYDTGIYDFGFTIWDGSTEYTAYSEDPADVPSMGQWYHVVGTYDGETVKLYKNGALTYTTSHAGTIDTNDSDIYFGIYEGLLAGSEYDGILDEIRIYNRALTPAEVQKLYQWAPGPVAYYSFDEGQGTGTDAVKDRSGNNLHGSMEASMTESDWVAGKYGKALDFDGSDDRLQMADNPSLDFGTSSLFTISSWIKLIGTGTQGIVDKADQNTDANGEGFALHYNSGISAVRMTYYDYNSGNSYCTFDGSTDIADGLWHHVVFVAEQRDGTCNSADASMYIDGTSESVTNGFTSSTSGTNLSNALPLQIGVRKISGSLQDYISGSIDDVRIYNYARTPQQIVQDMNAGHPAPGSPVGSAVGHWKFDEGYGDTANDSGNGGNNGNLAGACPGPSTCPTWTNDAKFGKALTFDGSGDYIDVGDPTEFQFNGSKDDFSVSAWFNKTGDKTDNHVLSKQGSTSVGMTYSLIGNSGGSMSFKVGVSHVGANGVTTTNAVSNGVWHHAVGTFDASEAKLYFYIDGVYQGQTAYTFGNKTSDDPLYIGSDYDDATNRSFNGKIDEVSIYNSTLDADQVKLLYNQGSSTVLGATGTDSSNNATWSAANEYCPPGQGTTCTPPVAEWKMDENTGTGSSAVKDTSGNNNHGTMEASMTESDWVKGKNGSALEFDGVNDNVSMTSLVSTQTNNISIEAWVKWYGTTAGNQYIFHNGNTGANGYTLTLVNADSNNIEVLNGGVGWADTDTSLTENTWQHIAAIRDAGTWKVYLDGQALTVTGNPTPNTPVTETVIGAGSSGGSGSFNGIIDKVVFYNYARSPAQISWEYNRGGPVGWWKFDECQGTTAYDSSGNGNNGTIIPGGAPFTSAGACSSGAGNEMWDNGAAGKRNASLDFDGTNDYVEITDTTGSQLDISRSITLGSWVYPRDCTGTGDGIQNIISKSAAYYFNLQASTCKPQFYFYGLSTPGYHIANTAIPLDQWSYIATTWNGSSVSIYINGQLDKTINSITGTGTVNNDTLSIGGGAAGVRALNGKVDNVQVYNYALTPQQIRNVMNEGAVRFGPDEGSP